MAPSNPKGPYAKLLLEFSPEKWSEGGGFLTYQLTGIRSITWLVGCVPVHYHLELGDLLGNGIA